MVLLHQPSFDINVFVAGKGSITGAGVSNVIPPIIDFFFHFITVSLCESQTSSAPL